MIQILHYFGLDENELRWSFIRSSGPGGQNVNKVATAVQLCLNVRQSPSIPEHLRDRLMCRLGHRLTNDGDLIIMARRHRSQLQNRSDALQRLIRLLEHACIEPKKRRRTQPGRAAKQKRLDIKRRHSEKKKMRKLTRVDYD
jgi:ribosome-associated protein